MACSSPRVDFSRFGINETEETKPSQAAESVPRQRKTAAAKPRSKVQAPAAKSKGRSASPQSKQDLVIRQCQSKSA